MKFDSDASVKRYANGAWKQCGGAPKMQKAIMPSLEKLLLRMRGGELGLGMQKLSAKAIEELAKAGDMEAPSGDEPAAAKPFVFPTPEGLNTSSVESSITHGSAPDLVEEDEAQMQRQVSEDLDVLVKHEAFSKLPADVVSHCNVIALSVVKEGKKKKSSGPKISANIAEQLEAVFQCLPDAEKPSDIDLPTVAEAVARGAMGSAYDLAHGSGDDDGECLLRVENLMLMYGGGKLLLKDTTLEMKKNCCYGVVGQNGAGKTTLMKEIATHRIVGMPAELLCVHVDDSKLALMSKSSLSVIEYCMKMAKDIGVDFNLDKAKGTLSEVGFAESALQDPVSELSTGWRMRLTLGVSMLKHADLVLLDEPTNHLDEQSVEWLAGYIKSITERSVMVISHEPKFLDKIVTHIVAYVDKKLEYTVGDFQAFAASKGLTKEQIDAMLSGNLSFDTKTKGDDDDDDAPLQVEGPAKLTFPIPGTMEGIKSGSRAVLESKDLSFRWASGKDYLINNVSVKATLSSRVAICGRNGCGKSTLMSLLCSEMSPSENSSGSFGEVWRHHNLRLGYLKQDHLTALGPFFETSSFVYITTRFKDGYDGDLQRRLITPESDEEAERRAKLAKEMGKYGNEVETLVSRSKNGTQLVYEVKWCGLDDPKQNTLESITKLRAMGLEKVVIAADERIAAKAAGLDQRPLTRREIVRHVEAFGIDEEMCCNQLVKGFSAGQKVRLSMSAMFWTKPHLICLDEPTNYLDVETVEALAKALINFRGGIVMIEPKTDFVDKICNEKWHLEDGNVTAEKLNNGVKRAA
jgi:ATPase subunit of ABC transporter with duplicated ATPase domains